MATHHLFRAKETGTRAGIMEADLERIYLEHMHH